MEELSSPEPASDEGRKVDNISVHFHESKILMRSRVSFAFHPYPSPVSPPRSPAYPTSISTAFLSPPFLPLPISSFSPFVPSHSLNGAKPYVFIHIERVHEMSSWINLSVELNLWFTIDFHLTGQSGSCMVSSHYNTKLGTATLYLK